MTDRDNTAEAINELAAGIHANAAEKGFWQEQRADPPVKLLLVISEVIEAMAEDREPRVNEWDLPEEFGVELADAIIRLLDAGYGYGFDMGELITAKVERNRSRPHMHGKRY